MKFLATKTGLPRVSWTAMIAGVILRAQHAEDDVRDRREALTTNSTRCLPGSRQRARYGGNRWTDSRGPS